MFTYLQPIVVMVFGFLAAMFFIVGFIASVIYSFQSTSKAYRVAAVYFGLGTVSAAIFLAVADSFDISIAIFTLGAGLFGVSLLLMMSYFTK